jgi:membrane-associated phospholipid phosphatase
MAPAALAIAALLVLEGERRLAVWWGLLFTAGLVLVTVTKIAFIGWGIGIRPLDFTGASGHAMRAMAVAPVIFYLLLQNAPRYVRVTGVAAGFAFGVIIGISRVVLHAHSVSEVVAGWLLGAVAGLCFIWIAGSLRRPVFNPARIAFGMVALIAAASHAQPVPTQIWLTKASLYISGHDKPFVRAGWKPAPRPQYVRRES